MLHGLRYLALEAMRNYGVNLQNQSNIHNIRCNACTSDGLIVASPYRLIGNIATGSQLLGDIRTRKLRY
jgi:hypothetical protein